MAVHINPSKEMEKIAKQLYPNHEIVGNSYYIAGEEKINCRKVKAVSLNRFVNSVSKTFTFLDTFTCNFQPTGYGYKIQAIDKFDVDKNFSTTTSKSGNTKKISIKSGSGEAECLDLWIPGRPSVLLCRKL